MTGELKLLGRDDEPQKAGSIVAVHWGSYRDQEIWVRSGANFGNWYPLGGEFGQPRVDEDRRDPIQKLMDSSEFQPRPGMIRQHPRWEDVLARGPVVLLTPGNAATYEAAWRAGRKDLAQIIAEHAESCADDSPSVVPE